MNFIKTTLILMLLALSLQAYEFGEDKADAWKNGFITCFKATKADANIQGLLEAPIKTKRYILYFDGKKAELAKWDELLILMFGYTRSIHSPIRTKSGWIIFTSSDSLPTAKQELDMLNKTIFKDKKVKDKLQLFDNEENRVFYAAKTIFAEEIKDLADIMKAQFEKEYKEKLDQHKKELNENQQVAILFVDKATNEVIKDEALKKELLQQQEQTRVVEPRKDVLPKKEVPKKEVPVQKNISLQELPKPLGKFELIADNVVVFKLNTQEEILSQSSYNVEKFEVVRIVEKDGSTYEYSTVLKDNDGTQYVKLYRKNLFIETSNVRFLNE